MQHGVSLIADSSSTDCQKVEAYHYFVKSTYSPEQAAVLLRDFPKPWWIAGGWAIDLFLDNHTREHEDLDIAILREDGPAFREYLLSWELWPGLGQGELESKPIRIDESLPPERHVLWCRPSSNSDWAFEVLLNETAGEEWVFRRDHRIRKPVAEIGSTASNGIAHLKPEIVLLFKAKNNLDKDQQDFLAALPTLTPEASGWLIDALRVVHPNHPWLVAL